MRRLPVVVALLLVVAACGAGEGGDATTSALDATVPNVDCNGNEIVPGRMVTCSLPGWPGRDYDVYVPEEFDPGAKWPVVVAYHGGGGTREAAARTSCPGGDLSDPKCLHSIGEVEGFFTVYPDGTARTAAGRFRTWNAGGEGELTCVVGVACNRGVDDIAYTAALLDDLGRFYSIEPRVTVTGLSNGGAMAHRAGCDLATRVKAVVAFGGANQQPGCVPREPVSVVQVHGTEDPCWPYEGGELGGCLGGEAVISGAVETAAGWAEAQSCGLPEESALPDTSDDGMTSRVLRWQAATVVFSLN